jgi:hypothetical protein
MLLGAGQARITSTLPLSIATLFGEIITPRYSTVSLLKELFLAWHEGCISKVFPILVVYDVCGFSNHLSR